MPGHDGSLFDPAEFPWLPLEIDDRTVLHMLRAVQRVEVGTGRSREKRSLSFATLDVEQIGYVYEGLLSFDGFRSEGVTVGLIGRPGMEDEVSLSDLEDLAARAPGPDALAAALAERHKDSGVGSATKLAKLLAPPDAVEGEEARRRLLAVTGGDYPLAERLLPFARVIRPDLRGLPVVILPGALFITESALRRNTGTHYTPRALAEQVVEGAVEPLVYRVGPLQTADRSAWVPRSSGEILSLKVADIAMGSAAFLVAAARYLAGHLIEAWSREGRPEATEHLALPADRRADEDRDPLVIGARRQVIEHCLYGVDINPMAVEMAKLSLWLVSMDPVRPFTFLDDRLVAGDSLLGITALDQLRFMHLDAKKGRALQRERPGRLHRRRADAGGRGVRDPQADHRRAAGRRPAGGVAREAAAARGGGGEDRGRALLRRPGDRCGTGEREARGAGPAGRLARRRRPGPPGAGRFGRCPRGGGAAMGRVVERRPCARHIRPYAVALAARLPRGLRAGRLRRHHRQPALPRRLEAHRLARHRLP
jgi:hypothetical protein